MLDKAIAHLSCGIMTHPSSGQFMFCFFDEGVFFVSILFLIKSYMSQHYDSGGWHLSCYTASGFSGKPTIILMKQCLYIVNFCMMP